MVVAGLHITALTYALYWLLPWFDLLMHFLGGFLVACIVVFVLLYLKHIAYKNLFFSGRRILFLVFTVTLFVGVMWEVFEYIFSLWDTVNYILDTAIDLVMDLLGAVSVYFVVVRSRLYSMLQ